MTHIFPKVISINVPTPPRIPRKTTWAASITPKNTHATTCMNAKPPSHLRNLELYSGAPKLITSSPSLSWLLVGILPSAISSALCVMAGSLPILAIATTVSPLV